MKLLLVFSQSEIFKHSNIKYVEHPKDKKLLPQSFVPHYSFRLKLYTQNSITKALTWNFLFLVSFLSVNDASKGRIINGTEAVLENTKHQVDLRDVISDSYFFGSGHKCGGSLIYPNVVLSAAHCFVDYDDPLERGIFKKKDDFYVVMGGLNRFKKTENTMSFAILILNGSVPENHPTIQPIPLNAQQIKNGTICQATGWGITEDGISTSYLMTVDLPYLSNEFCIANSVLTADALLDGMFCAGYVFEGQRDACQGDSGGPFVCNKQLVGIVSWGNRCALPRNPGIYTDVKYYEPWLQARLAEEGFSEVTTEKMETTTSPTKPGNEPTTTTPTNMSAKIKHLHLILLFVTSALNIFGSQT